ncbi:winged helix DNA-binding domain-containing protein [Salininema proteolyticum]|uniref:Winged helix DNA-binding domain-containing protein n=1 Tax=Salininema proteolyticum TaxID=1607685 RepID=A0ABV8TZY5_9ACTN
MEMTAKDVALWRAQAQKLHGEPLKTVEDAFAFLGAVQSQEVGPSKLTPVMRSRGGLADVDDLIGSGKVIRTHVLRPTWHYVPVELVRAMLVATAERVMKPQFSTAKTVGLERAELDRAAEALEEATRGGRHLTRDECSQVLADKGFEEPVKLRLVCMLMHAELMMGLCSGEVRDGRQTYANFDERVPKGIVDRGDAIRDLAKTFFESRGPATLKDFTRWSSLTVKDAKAAVAELGLESLEIAGREVLFSGERLDGASGVRADLVQGWDEMLCAYTDSKAWVHGAKIPVRPKYTSALLIDGMLVGHWKKDKGVVSIAAHRELSAGERGAIGEAAERLGQWTGEALTVDLE